MFFINPLGDVIRNPELSANLTNLRYLINIIKLWFKCKHMVQIKWSRVTIFRVTRILESTCILS